MSTKNSLAEKFHAAQEKNVYFLMAVAASAIGFSFTQAKLEPLTLSHVAWFLSVVFWGGSFYCGNEFIQWTNSFTKKNAEYLSKDFFPELNAEAQRALIIKSEELHSSKIRIYGSAQNKLLIIGAFTYCAFHMLRMLSITPG